MATASMACTMVLATSRSRDDWPAGYDDFVTTGQPAAR
jgi:hypothetical protein